VEDDHAIEKCGFAVRASSLESHGHERDARGFDVRVRDEATSRRFEPRARRPEQHRGVDGRRRFLAFRGCAVRDVHSR
jgi:hypothetical protein